MMNQQTYEFSSKDGMTLFSRAWLTRKPKPKGIVHLVHGLGEHTGRYAHVAEALNQAGYHLTGFDLRGHGLSEGKRGYAPDYDHIIDDIQLSIQETRRRYGQDLPEFIYGHSLGGNLVIIFGLKRTPKVNGIIATAPYLRPTNKLSPAILITAKILSKTLPSITLNNGLEKKALSRDQSVVNAYINDAYVHEKISASLANDMFTSGDYALRHAHDLEVPMLLMHGTADRICSCEASQGFVQSDGNHVDFVPWEGGYHEIHNDLDKEKVIQKMVEWLDGHLNP